MNKIFDFKTLKAQLSIDQVLDAYGFNKHLKQIGTQLRGPCPIHGGDNPTAFRAHLSKGIWRCFTACGGGDTVDLVRIIEHCSFAEAARQLYRIACGGAQKLNPISNHSILPQRKSPFMPFARPIALTSKVGFLQEGKKITVETATAFEAGVSDQSKFLKGMVAVRLHDLIGNPLEYCGRHLHEHDVKRWGKWRFPKNFPKNEIFYNAHRAQPYRKNTIFVVEGPWGVMRLTQAGVPNTVALLGATVSSLQIDWLTRSSSVVLLLDGDNAGRKATEKIYGTLAPRTKVEIHRLPEGMDPDDFTDAQLGAICRTYCSGGPGRVSLQKTHENRGGDNA